VRVFENRMLTKIFGPKRDEVTGGWRKLHNEEHHNVYSSPSDGYSVCYATASKVRITSDVSIATQRLRIFRQPNC
jgi:hypothetical protein